MPDTAKRLVGPSQLGSSVATLYTVPSATTAIVRHIRLVNTSSLNVAGIRLQIGAGDSAALRFIDGLTLSKGATYDWSGFLVMAAAELLRGYAGTGSAVTIIVSGIEIS